MKWTVEQEQAISSRNSNLLVAAAAGSGKTAVLVERIIGRIIPDSVAYDKSDYTDIDRMLVVTFTRDAASELRERLDKAIDKKIEQCIYPELSELMFRQKALLAKSYITTIDSFCLNVVKQNFIQCGIDASFAVGNGSELELLEEDVLTEILEEYYKDSDPDFVRVAETYSDKTDDVSLKETILNIYRYAQNDVNPKAWIETQRERYSCDADFDFWNSVWGGTLSNYFLGFVRDIHEEYCELQNLCYKYDIVEYQGTIDNEAETFDELYNLLKSGMSQDSFSSMAKPLSFQKMKSVKKKTIYSQSVLERRNKARKQFEELYKNFFSGPSPQEQMKLLRGDINCICDIVLQLQERLLAEKYSQRIYSFNDIAHFALDLLVKDCRKDGKGFVPTDIAVRFQKQFDEIYIDEYQDTSIIQEVMLSSLAGRACNAKNIFMVGDIKQSIYGFRQACPEFFLEKYNSYEERECDNRLICLYKNFRSRRNVVDGANAVFSKIMKSSTADMDYTEKEYLNFGAEYYEKNEESLIQNDRKCEFVIIGKKATEDFPEVDKLSSYKAEAHFIAGKILDMMSSGYKVFDTSINEMRPVKFSDFVILMRYVSNCAPQYAEVLGSYGIPVFAPAKKQFYDTPEIATVLSFLKIIDNPYQDIPMMSVMKSPLYNFTDEDIAVIKNVYKYCDLYTSCLMFSKGDFDNDKKKSSVKIKTESFLRRLEELRALSVRTNVYDILWLIVNENDFYNKMGMFGNGEISQANVRLLLDMADSFDSSGGQGLFRFIRNIQRLENENKQIEEASVCSESADVVRIKTIHKSKGLEFPVVFLSDIGRTLISKQDKTTEKSVKTMLIHRNLGINPVCYKKGKYVSGTYPSIMWNIAEQVQRREKIAEEMRLLYVAITRAREKFFAVGTGKEDELNCYDGLTCNTFGILNKPTYKDWILMSTDDSDCWEKYYIPKEDAVSYPDSIKANVMSDNDSEKISFDSMKTTENHEITSDDKADSIIPVKISVSDIKRIHAAQNDDGNIQDLFAKKRGVVMKSILRENDKNKKHTFTSAEKGTLTHTCLQLMDFEKCREIYDADAAEKYIESFLCLMKEKNVFDAAEADAIERRILVKFILSDIGKRIFNAKKVYRETPFTIRMKWREISGEKGVFGDDEYVSVQGVIDCFIVENDGCIVIDYKTDYLKPESAVSVDESYKIQIKCYSDAIEKITGKKVKESHVVYLRNL